MSALGELVRGEGTIYLTGGATALLRGWRDATIDVDIKPDPEPAGLFEALREKLGEIETLLPRYPAIDARSFRRAVEEFVGSERGRLLQAQGGDAYSRYNALMRELASFEAARDGRLRRGAEHGWNGVGHEKGT